MPMSQKPPGPARPARVALFLSALALSLSVCGPAAGQQGAGPATRYQQFYRIEVEDADEAALVEQELRLKPVLVRGRSFYYYGNEEVNRRLRAAGYEPRAEDADNVLTRVVRVAGKRGEGGLREAGVTLILRERGTWVVRGTARQLRALTRSGYAVNELGRREPRPRQVRVVVASRDEVTKVVAPRIDIYGVTVTRAGYEVVGGAFDNAIDELKALGLKVQILPDPPGVIR